MKNIEILDCTLRDGGYVNDNNFGEKNIKKLIEYLHTSGIDIIECGYLMDDIEDYNKDKTEFSSTESVEKFLIPDTTYTLMLLGEKYKIENLPKHEDTMIDTIRMSFHKKSIRKAIEYAKEINKKGYKLFLQPTTIMSYKEEEIINMLEEFNKLDVECVAIVDTFGQMNPEDTKRMTELFDTHLRKNIKLGIHLHNNLQTAFANAITFLDTVNENRNVAIDTSLLGMGRGAGNLPTELLANYLNNNYGKNYDLVPLLEASDNIIAKIKEEHEWGYSLPYYLSAINGIHPSYIILFLERKTLNSVDINNLIRMIPEDKKVEFDRDYAEELYRIYNDKDVDDELAKEKLGRLVNGKKIILIGPGKSIIDYKDKIEDILGTENSFSIAINGNDLFYTDATFYSNKKRYEELSKEKNNNLTILTSNIKTESEEDELIFDYSNSLSREYGISDNSLLIMLNILKELDIEEILLVGFDGFSSNIHDNFYSDERTNILTEEYITKLNELTTNSIKEYSKKIKINSVTPTKYMED